jgi:SAM-dependent methyltransferase
VASFSRQLWQAVSARWREESERRNPAAATADIFGRFCSFLRDSTPERRRSRYGDMEYDWEHRVNTSGGSVRWRERLLGQFHSPYQPTDATLFRQMMESLPIDFREFTFVDIGSGKGRTLLMASEYPFRRIIGVEILQELHAAAVENIAAYRSEAQQCKEIESVCIDALAFTFPDEPLLLYLFNPLPAESLQKVLENLKESLNMMDRKVYIVYHNPLLEHLLQKCDWLEKIPGVAASVYCHNSCHKMSGED